MLAREGSFRARLESLTDLPIVGDGNFYGIELVKDKQSKASFDDTESERLLRGFLSPALYDAGLICRADDRGEPVVQLSPPLICTDDAEDRTHPARPRTEAWSRI
jgi:adenosylmethionine-8-amino-7-oxononanoate aminotransferase